MPTPKVVATLPFTAARATLRPARQFAAGAFPSNGPATLSFADAHRARREAELVGDAYRELLEEATELTARLGHEVRGRRLGGAGGGCRMVGGRMRVVIDLDSTPRARLAVIAAALRTERRLATHGMSDELADYLASPRAA